MVRLAWFVMCLTCAMALGTPTTLASQTRCPSEGVAVQVLGSGGPRTGSDRASASYLVWVDGRARVMVDAGGGSFVRFGASGARLADLRLIALSHLHPDHVTDLAGLLWLSDADRVEPLRMVGPSGAGDFPAFDDFLQRLFHPESGAFPVLSGVLGGEGRGVRTVPNTVDVTQNMSSVVLEETGLQILAHPVPHGPVPALAFRVEINGLSVVFSGDQNGSDSAFVEFSEDATALVMHLAVPPQISGFASELHATPDVVGRVAKSASVRELILSHLFAHDDPADLETGIEEVRARYSGSIRVAEDLACYPVR